MSSVTDVFGWRAWRQPSTNFLVPPKLGYSVRTLRPHTCLILPFVHNRISHEKRFSQPRGSKELHKREKNWNPKTKWLCE